MTETLHQVQMEDGTDLGTRERYSSVSCTIRNEISYEMRFLSTREMYSILRPNKVLTASDAPCVR